MMKTKEKNASAKRKSFYKDLMHYEPTLKCGKNIGTKENGGEVYIETKMFGDSVEMARSWAYASVENIGRKRLAYWINSQIPPPTCLGYHIHPLSPKDLTCFSLFQRLLVEFGNVSGCLFF